MTQDKAKSGAESRALTGLRGLAAALIVAHHIYLHVGLAPALEPLQPALRHGYLAVDLFFVLSGFVLSMTYGDWFAAPRPGAPRPDALAGYLRFLCRRVARLWPLHVSVLLALLMFKVDVYEHPPSVRSVLMNAAMIQAWGFSSGINPPSWSISTEFLAAVLFPILALLALRGRVTPVLCAAAIVLALLFCVTHGPPIGEARRGALDLFWNYTFLPAIRCLAGFTLGMLAWRAGQVPLVQSLASNPLAGPLAVLAAAALLAAGAPDLLIYPIFPLIVLGLHYGRSPVHRLLSIPPIHTIGALSYAIYLIHYELLMKSPLGWAPMPVVLTAYALATLLLAALAHAIIEKPGRQAIRALDNLMSAAIRARSRISGARLQPTLHDRTP